MKKTKESIIKKREKKKAELDYSCSLKLGKKMKEIMLKSKLDSDKQIERANKKMNSYLNKKKLEYDRKCKNEIRKLEGKEEKVYKKKKKPLNLDQFAMELMQEHAKLRDTDISGRGVCISCMKLCERSELAWWHRYSRRIKNICLCDLNINAQCHTCNFTTWPRWDTVAAERTNMNYDKNLDRKYWKWTSGLLRVCKDEYFKKSYNGKRFLWTKECIPTIKDKEEFIEMLIDDVELRWKWKDFYKPWKKWRKIWEEYKNS